MDAFFSMEVLALVAGYVVVLLVGGFGAVILFKIIAGQIDLSYLVAEKNGQASFSRFQFMVFTFVVAMCVLVLTLESGRFPALGMDVLGLIGISGGTYALSKSIHKGGQPEGTGEEESNDTVANPLQTGHEK